MSYRHTLEATLDSLHEIEDLIKGFSSDGNIPAIELDLALQKLRNLYELMLMLKSRETSSPETKPQAADTDKTPVKATESQVEVRKIVEEKIQNENVIVEQKSVEEELKTTTSAGVEKTITVKSTATRKTRESEIQTLGDQFKGRTTLHESLHQNFKSDSSLSHVQPIANLLSAIAINDRFTLVRDLFENNTQLFESTIHDLNDAGSFNDAYNYMTQYFNWDMDSEPVQMLLDIIRRKFIKSRNE